MRSIFLSFTLLFTFSVYGQLPFSQANRAGLLFNPSLAGAKQVKQLSFIGNTNYSHNHNNKNLFLSYDQPSEKLNSGIGFYYIFEEDKNEKDLSSFQIDKTVFEENQYRMEGVQHSMGISISPKLNVMSKANFHIAKLTISPSFFLEFKRGSFTLNDHFTQNDYGSRIINTENANGTTPVLDSSVTQFFRNRSTISNFSSGIGVLISTQKSIISLKFPFHINKTREEHSLIHHKSIGNETRQQTASYSRPWFSWTPTLNVGRSFSLKKGKNYFLIPMTGISMKQYFNRSINESNYKQGFYSEVIQERKYAGINYLHGTINLRIEKIVLGWSYTRSNDRTYSGLNLGFQAKKIKVFTNTNLIGVRQFELATQVILGR